MFANLLRSWPPDCYLGKTQMHRQYLVSNWKLTVSPDTKKLPFPACEYRCSVGYIGIEFHIGIKIIKIEHSGTGGLYASPWGLYKVTVEKNGTVFEIEAEALLNATGRAPNVHDVGLETVCFNLLQT